MVEFEAVLAVWGVVDGLSAEPAGELVGLAVVAEVGVEVLFVSAGVVASLHSCFSRVDD